MIKVAVFGIVASLIAMKIKTIRPEIAILIAVISSILLAMYGLKQMEEILAVFETIRSYSKIPKSYFQILLKLIGISFICEFASNICKDAAGIDCKTDRVCRETSNPDRWTSSL